MGMPVAYSGQITLRNEQYGTQNHSWATTK